MVVMEKAKRKHLYRGRLHYHKESNKIEVILGSQESMSITDLMLAHMTGWEEAGYEMINMGASLM